MQTAVLVPFPFYLVRLLAYHESPLLHSFKDWTIHPDPPRISLCNLFVVLHLHLPTVNFISVHDTLAKRYGSP